MKHSLVLKASERGFSLPELMIATAIIGVLSSIAIPTFMDQMQRTQQREVEATISQIMFQTASHFDEYGLRAEGWNDLDDIATVMTDTGTASGATFASITLPGANYTLEANRNANDYIFTATPTDTNANGFNVLGCINVSTGASNIQTGDGTTAAVEADLTCP